MSIWQTKDWQEMLLESKQTSAYFYIWDIYVEKRQLSLWEYGLFVLWWSEMSLIKYEKRLIDLCKKEKVLFLQYETYVFQDTKKQKYDWKFIPGAYYKKFITPYTAYINLDTTLDEILSNMKPKGRYNIKLAEKRWVKTLLVKKNIKNIKIFYELMNETTTRDGFSGNSLEYYKIFLETIANSELIFAVKDEYVIAAGIFTFSDQESIYYYGASTSAKKYRNLMAPYLLQWFAIGIAKERWSKIYDFLWIASPWDAKTNLWGVTDFKLKLTPSIIEVSQSYIYVYKKWKYYLFKILKSIK